MKIKKDHRTRKIYTFTKREAIELFKDLLCLEAGVWSYKTIDIDFNLALAGEVEDKTLATAEIQEEISIWLNTKERKEYRKLILNTKEN